MTPAHAPSSHRRIAWTARLAAAAIALVFLVTHAHAAQIIHTNGQGGGRWTDPSTWHGGIMPTAADTVIVATRDVVEFDGVDATQPHCAGIRVDPAGTLSFRAPLGAEKYTLIVNGPIESYGTIRLDATNAPRGGVELRLVSDQQASRTIRLFQNGSFLVYGRKGMQNNQRNITVATVEPAEGQPRLPATVYANNDSMLDISNARLSDVVLMATDLDNTGAATNERLNVTDNQFTGIARVTMLRCDTPVVRGNTFTAGAAVLADPAIYAGSCSLAQIAQNTITGNYAVGISTENDTDSSATGNRVENAPRGVLWRGRNAMIKGNIFKACTIGVQLNAMSGVVEDLVVDGAKTGIELQSSVVQLTDCRISAVEKDGTVLGVNASAVTLLNCNIPAEQIKVAGNAPGGAVPVESLQYVVVKVNGKYPAGTQVVIRTNEASGGKPNTPGAADLNVRNAPASLTRNSFTPMPRTLNALVVRCWRLDSAGKKMAPALFYDLLVTAPAATPDLPPTILKQQLLEPDDKWYRDDANKPVPTLEVAIP